MHFLITGGAGFLGINLCRHLLRRGHRVRVLDLVDFDYPENDRVEAFRGDVRDAGTVDRVVRDIDVVVHAAAALPLSSRAEILSTDAEGTAVVLERAFAAGVPRLVFTSSLAVFGPPFPSVIPDDFAPTPATSYGTQKTICELLLADYSRKGFVDGVGIRLPTICVRPGKPNRAASGFFSGIIREPLNGVEAVLPVPDTVRHWHASPRSAVGFLIHGAGLDTTKLGNRRSITMPGVSATVADEIEALRKVAGEKAVSLIRREPDELVMRIVSGWAESYEAKRAKELGFRSDNSFEDIIRVHIEDEMGGKIA